MESEEMAAGRAGAQEGTFVAVSGRNFSFLIFLSFSA